MPQNSHTFTCMRAHVRNSTRKTQKHSQHRVHTLSMHSYIRLLMRIAKTNKRTYVPCNLSPPTLCRARSSTKRENIWVSVNSFKNGCQSLECSVMILYWIMLWYLCNVMQSFQILWPIFCCTLYYINLSISSYLIKFDVFFSVLFCSIIFNCIALHCIVLYLILLGFISLNHCVL